VDDDKQIRRSASGRPWRDRHIQDDSQRKTMTVDGMMGSIASHLVFDRVK